MGFDRDEQRSYGVSQADIAMKFRRQGVIRAKINDNPMIRVREPHSTNSRIFEDFVYLPRRMLVAIILVHRSIAYHDLDTMLS